MHKTLKTCLILFISMGIMAPAQMAGKDAHAVDDAFAPAPTFVRFDGTYQFLSHLYYPCPEQPRRPRSVVVLNFMGLNCPPCAKELPIFLEVVRPSIEAAEAEGRRVKFFAVSLDPLSERERLKRFLNHFGIDTATETLLDPYQRGAARFGVSGIPRTLVIAPNGRITADITGLVENYRALLTQGIQSALEEDVGL